MMTVGVFLYGFYDASFARKRQIVKQFWAEPNWSIKRPIGHLRAESTC